MQRFQNHKLSNRKANQSDLSKQRLEFQQQTTKNDKQIKIFSLY